MTATQRSKLTPTGQATRERIVVAAAQLEGTETTHPATADA